MKFSIRVQYGLQALLELALKYGSGPIQIGDIAKNQKVPIRYLEQLLLILKRRGFVVSTRGKHGGYTLAKHASDISVLEIIETLDGPIELTTKKMKRSSVLFEAFAKIQEKIRKDLVKTSLEDLVFKKRQKERAYVYNI
jgi:Rrf2 family protein